MRDTKATRKRRRTPKTAKILKNHSGVRAAQRYELYLDDERREKILTMIKEGGVTTECFAVEKQSINRTLFRVIIEGKVCGVVYDKKRKELVTFIPSDDPRLKLPPIKLQQKKED